MAASLESYVNRNVSIITADGRIIQGLLKGFDQKINLVLGNSVEQVFSTSRPVETVHLGVYIIRGDNVALVGEIDEDLEKQVDFANIRAEPLCNIVH